MSQRAEWERWAKRASREVRVTETHTEWGEWIVANAADLHRCEIFAPTARSQVQQAIKEAVEEIERKCRIPNS